MTSRAILSSVALGALVLGLTSTADAHFYLQSPPAATEQDELGNPQKTGPCGDGTPTGEITTYQAGSTIEITIDETITHPGHYRVALAVNDTSELPDPPPITPVGNDQCGSTTIMDPPVFPVLADGMLVHTAAFDGPQTMQVTLPEDITCDNCTIQILEYMSNHGAPCFYYHCANIAIQEEPVTTTSSTSAGNGGSTGMGGGTSSGGSDGSGGGTNAGNNGNTATQPAGQKNYTSDGGCAMSPAKGPLGERTLGGAALLGALLLMSRRRRRQG